MGDKAVYYYLQVTFFAAAGVGLFLRIHFILPDYIKLCVEFVSSGRQLIFY